MEFAGNSDEVIIQHVNRLQNEIRVLLAAVDGSSIREIFRDEDEAWAEVCDELEWIEGGSVSPG